MANVEIEDVIIKMREDLKKMKKSDIVEVAIQSQMQVMDLVWSLDNERKDNHRLRGLNNRQHRSIGGVTLS